MTRVPLRTLVSAIGLFVAAAVVVTVPSTYFVVGYASLAHEHTVLADIAMTRVARHAYVHPTGWRYQEARLSELLERNVGGAELARQRVVTADGVTIVEIGPTPAWPARTQAMPIVVSGAEIGHVDISGSLLPLLLRTGLAVLFSGLLGFGIYFAVRTFPLRVLDETLGELRHSRQRLKVANSRLVRRNAELRRRDKQLHRQNLQFDAALNNMSQGLTMFDAAGELIVCNRRFASLFQVPEELIRPGMTIAELMRVVRTVTDIIEEDPDQMLTHLTSLVDRGLAGSWFVNQANGKVISVSHEPLAAGGWVDTFTDVTQRRRDEARIVHLARHDALTELPNRTFFYEQMKDSLAHLRQGRELCVFSLDLDAFKSVNDSHGHQAGDRLLAAVAARMRDCLHKGDLIARLGGDEFAIVQLGDATAASALAGRLIAAVGAGFDVDDHQIVTGVSIGIAVAPADGDSPEVLLKNADLALYRAKADRRGTYRFFEPEMDEHMRLRRELEAGLRIAVARDEFELNYQPLLNIKTGRVTCLEALIRWHHPERGLISPADFIPLAEETGLIVPIGAWVLRRACAEAAAWPEVRVAVNVSPAQFKSRDDLVDTVAAALAASGLPPHRLELEITEAVLMEQDDFSLATLHRLRDLGVKIAMDDFGTGYSSLGYLRAFPFDKIKIDRSFVSDLSTADDSLAIVRAVIGLSSSLGIVTTAEGVETVQQLDRLREEGCTEAQGFLFSQPRPAREIAFMLSQLVGSADAADAESGAG